MTAVNPYSTPNPQPEDDPPLMAQLSTDVEGMTVEFEQTLEDILALQYHLQGEMGIKPPSRWVGVLYGCLIGMMSVLMFAVLLVPALADLTGLVMAGLVLIAVCLLISYGVAPLSRWNLRRAVLRFAQKGHNRNLTGLRRVMISPQFLTWSSPITQTVSRWVGVEKVLWDDENLFLFITTMDALILPRRAFNSEQHFREYAQAAEKYRQQDTP